MQRSLRQIDSTVHWTHEASLPPFKCTVLSTGQCSLGSIRFTAHKSLAHKPVLVSLDPHTVEWIVSYLDPQKGQKEIARRPLKDLDLSILTLPVEETP